MIHRVTSVSVLFIIHNHQQDYFSATLPRSLELDSGPIHPVSVVRDLGAMLDCELSMKQHVTEVASSCFYHLRRLKQTRRLVGQEVTAQLVQRLSCPALIIVMLYSRGYHVPL